MKILLVEDDKKVADFISRGLTSEGYLVETAINGQDGYEQALDEFYDVILLDWMIPGMSGIELLKKIREQNKQIPILILTAKDSIEDRVRGLDEGADDYLTKPFAFAELVARIRALVRREQTVQQQKEILEIADLQMNLKNHVVTRSGKGIDLTAKEFLLLEYFLRHREKVVTRSMIADHVWGQDFDGFTNVIDVYVRYLRKKIDEGFSESLIHTIRGVGYKLSAEP